MSDSETKSKSFFYNCKILQGSNHTYESNGNVSQLSITRRPTVFQIVFVVKLCTQCGCGEAVTKVFQLASPANVLPILSKDRGMISMLQRFFSEHNRTFEQSFHFLFALYDLK